MTEEEAKELAKEYLKDKFVVDFCDENEEVTCIEFIEGEMLVDTDEFLSVENNGGYSTIEILYDTETICGNGK